MYIMALQNSRLRGQGRLPNPKTMWMHVLTHDCGNMGVVARLVPNHIQTMIRPPPAVTVWYDGSCPLCIREIAVMRRLDRASAIAFVDVASPTSVCPLDAADLLARFHAEENGTLLSGAAAFAAMWRAIPMLRPLGLAARNRWVLAGLERLYIVFLRHRPKLQRFVTRLERANH